MRNSLKDLTRIQVFIRERRKKTEESALPLKSIRVIDLGSFVAAPFAATLLGDFGAEVIKIEPPDVPIRLLKTPGQIRFPGLPMGSANEVVLEDLLGYSPEEAVELKNKGAI